MDFLSFSAALSMSIVTSVKVATMPIIKVIIMCALGYILATKRVGLLTAPGIKFLSKLVFMVFLPCLIFTQLGSAITFHKMIEWWFIPVNVVIAALGGCTIGCLVAWIVKPPPQFIKYTIIAIGIGNIGNIPLVLIDAVCRDTNSPFGTYATCSTNGVAYISYGQWVGALIVYTFVYHMLSPSEEQGEGITAEPNGNSPLLTVAVGKDEIIKVHEKSKNIIQRVIASCTQALGVPSLAGMLKQIFQPPVTASMIALVVGAIPFLKNLILVESGALYFLTDSLSIIGDAMIPTIMLTLGGNLVGGPGASELGLRTTVAIVLVRLFVIPFMGTGVVVLAKKLGFLVDDDLFEFVLLLQHSMPSSILAGSVAALRGVAAKEAAAVLFYEHIVAILSVSLSLVCFVTFLL